jgi:glucose-1-phosphate cytidylyltransferase
MKAVILAGGFGTRLSEETTVKPKPLVEIGGFPILWHIMKTYSEHGVRDFVICAGYKGSMIKDYFYNYSTRMSDMTVSTAMGECTFHKKPDEDWKVTIVDTGADAMTGGRLAAVADYLDDGEPFCMTYGDGVGNVDITASIAFHKAHGKKATVTAVTPPGRFGVLDIDGTHVKGFREKISSDQYRINAGYFVLEKSAISYVADALTSWEDAPLQQLAAEGELEAFEHLGFWQPMDTIRDRSQLEKLWAGGNAPWKIWE